MRQKCPKLQGHSDFVFSVAYSPDGKRIVSGSGDRTVRIWDAAMGKEVSGVLYLLLRALILTCMFGP